MCPIPFPRRVSAAAVVLVCRNKRGGASGTEVAAFSAGFLDTVGIAFLPFLVGRRGEERAFFFAFGALLGLVFLGDTFAFETRFRLGAFAAALGFAFFAGRAALRDIGFFVFF